MGEIPSDQHVPIQPFTHTLFIELKLYPRIEVDEPSERSLLLRHKTDLTDHASYL